MHRHGGLALDGGMAVDAYGNMVAAHLHDGGRVFTGRHARRAVEQGNAVARLHAKYLHMARSLGGEIQLGASAQFHRAIKTGHVSGQKYYRFNSYWRLMVERQSSIFHQFLPRISRDRSPSRPAPGYLRSPAPGAAEV
ncbi:hypothetical protein D3C71_1673800 [compost metagenome]